MAIQISGTPVIDNSRNIINAVAGTFSSTITTVAGTLGSNGNGTRSLSTSEATGGSDGDIWYQY